MRLNISRQVKCNNLTLIVYVDYYLTLYYYYIFFKLTFFFCVICTEILGADKNIFDEASQYLMGWYKVNIYYIFY